MYCLHNLHKYVGVNKRLFCTNLLVESTYKVTTTFSESTIMYGIHTNKV